MKKVFTCVFQIESMILIDTVAVGWMSHGVNIVLGHLPARFVMITPGFWFVFFCLMRSNAIRNRIIIMNNRLKLLVLKNLIP